MNRKMVVISTFYSYHQEKCEVGQLFKFMYFENHRLEIPLLRNVDIAPETFHYAKHV